MKKNLISAELWSVAASSFPVRKFFLPVFICAISSIVNPLCAQELIKDWDKTIGWPSDDFLKTVVPGSDGGYLLAGYSYLNATEFDPTKRGIDYWIVKISSAGTRQWDKAFGGNNSDLLYSAIRTSDGGYLLGGYSSSGISGDKSEASRGGEDYWIVKINSTGTKQWDKTFGGASFDVLSAVIQTSDGGYLLAGHSSSGASGEKSQSNRGASDFWVVKITSNGSKQWDRTFGGNSMDFLRTIIQTPDGGYLLGGESYSDESGDKTAAAKGGNDFWIVKISAAGTKQWDKSFGGSGDDRLASIVRTSDGGYLLGGTYPSSFILGDEYWIVKISSTGVQQWSRMYGGTDTDVLESVISTSGGYLLAGWSKSGKLGSKSQPSRGKSDYWIIKINSIGDRQWDKTYGGNSDDFLTSVIEISSPLTGTEGYVLAGDSYSSISGDKSQPLIGANDYWVVKIKFESVIIGTASAGISNESAVKQEILPLSIKASPNPFTDKVTLSFTLKETELVNLQVHDLNGNSISNLFTGEAIAGKTYSFALAASSLSPGVYIASLKSSTRLGQVKLVLAR